MSRDRKRPGSDASDAPDASIAASIAASGGGAAAERSELLTAYVDGVAELPVDERRAVERWLADHPEARTEAAELQGLLGRLRALPGHDGDEPDWAAMERSIQSAVADVPIRPWWRRWQWLVPAMTCATAAAVLLVVWPRTQDATVIAPDRGSPRAPSVPSAAPAPAAPSVAPSVASDDGFALWLDGRVVDIEPGALGSTAAETVAQELPAAVDDVLGAGDDEHEIIDASDETGLLPVTNLAWLDTLDDAALDRAERWLARPASTGGGDASGSHRKKS